MTSLSVNPREYFRHLGTRPRKRFGQHFLVQPGTAERIVECAGLDPSDVAVEVGPGLGALTQAILPRVRRLHLVELDRDLATHLENTLAGLPCEVFVHSQDILDFDWRGVSEREGRGLVVLGNLPYNITSPLVFRFLEAMPWISRAVVMVQKEVGERLAAEPGSKTYGVLSVLLGVYARVEALFTVAPAQFYPPPQVDSIVVSIDFTRGRPFGDVPLDRLRPLVNAAFQKRRKTLLNALRGFPGLPGPRLQEAFERAGIDPRRRPETLSPEEFVKMVRDE